MNWFVRLITLNWPDAITFAPIGIYIKDRRFNDQAIRNHESTHWYQQLEVYAIAILISLLAEGILLLFNIFAWWLIIFLVFPFAFFYIWYLVEWIIKYITPPIGAYRDIGFEREAKGNEQNLDYNKTRKHFCWLKYIIQ